VEALKQFKSPEFCFYNSPGLFNAASSRYLISNVPQCLTYLHLTDLVDPLLALDLPKLSNLLSLKLGHLEPFQINDPHLFGVGFTASKLRQLILWFVTAPALSPNRPKLTSSSPVTRLFGAAM